MPLTSEQLAEEKARRFRFTNQVYDATGANEHVHVKMDEIGKALGFDGQTTERIMQYLHGEGVLEYKTLDGGIGITHAGIAEVESAIEQPDRSTEHFPPVNYIYVHQMTNSNIQQGTVQSTQSQTISQQELKSVSEFLELFRQKLPNLPLTADDRAEAEAELKTMEAQVGSKKPKLAILRVSVAAMKDILLRIGSSIAAQELLRHLPKHI